VTPPDPATFSPQVRAAVAELHDIVARRDLAAFKRHLLAETTISFGGDYGPQGLDTMWAPQRSDTRLWTALGEILRLGGMQEASQEGAPQWCAPWAACMDFDLPGDLTGYDVVVVSGTHVAVRAQPDAGAPLLGRTGPAVLVLADAQDGDEPWAVVRWHGGVGYVRKDLARSPVDLRITLQIDPDDWHIRYFVAGD